MKTSLRALAVAIFFMIGSGALFADGGYNFSVTLAQKKEGNEKQNGKGMTATVQKWSFTVSLENHSFKDVPACEIRYVTFVKPVARSGKGLIRHEGKVSVPGITNNGKFVFETEAVEIVGAVLQPGYVWSDGDTGSPKDKLRGIWFRVYIDGQQVFEFVNPQELHSQESFEAPAKQ